MSQPSLVELIRVGIEIYNRGDYTALANGYTEDATATAPTVWLEDQSTVSGRDAIIERYHVLPGAFADIELVEERLLEHDAAVYGYLIMRGTPHGGATKVDTRLLVVYRFTGGRVNHVGFYVSLPEALANDEIPETVVRALSEPPG